MQSEKSDIKLQNFNNKVILGKKIHIIKTEILIKKMNYKLNNTLTKVQL